MQDPLNPTCAELQEWAYATAPQPVANWDTQAFNTVADVERNRLILAFAGDSSCPNQSIFLGFLYVMTGSVTRFAARDGFDPISLAHLKALMAVAAQSQIPSLQEWARKSQTVIDDPRLFRYDDWYNSAVGTNETKQTHGIKTDTWVETPHHPWLRYFARLLDIGTNGFLFFFVFGFTLYFVSPSLSDSFDQLFVGRLGHLLDILLTSFTSIFVTALFLSQFGTSFGKYCFGIRVRNKDGSPLTYLQALKREFLVLGHGLAFSIPIISLITLATSYKKLARTQTTKWDAEMGTVVLYRPVSSKRTILNILSFILFLCVFWTLIYLDMRALHEDRGDGIKTHQSSAGEDTVARSLVETADMLNQTVQSGSTDTVKLDHVSAQGRVLTYNYTVNKYGISPEIADQLFYGSIVPKACADPDMRETMKAYGVTYRYSYRVPDRPTPFAIDVNWSMCVALAAAMAVPDTK